MSKELLHPGIYLEELGGIPRIVGVSVSTGGMVCKAKKGPLDKVTFSTSWSQWIDLQGGFYQNLPGALSAFAFFENGGRRLYTSRVASDDIAVADGSFKDLGNSNNTLKSEAANGGDWGNAVGITIKRWGTTLAASLTGVSVSTAVLASVQDVELGDRVILTDGVKKLTVDVLAVNVSTGAITFRQVNIATLSISWTIPANVKVLCSTSHLGSTTSKAIMATGATSILVNNSNGFNIGSVVMVANSSVTTSFVVTGVSGNTLSFASITLSASIPATALIVSQEFNLKVLDNGVVAETPFNYLSMEETNEVNFIETRLSGDGNQSNYVVLTDLDSASSKLDQIPYPVENVLLTGGDDGSALVDNDYIGSAVQGSESGLHLFDKVIGLNMICIPGVTTIAVQRALADWCDNRLTIARPAIGIVDVPEADDTPLEAQDWRTRQLNLDTSHVAMYYPWLKVSDPVVSGRVLNQAPSGHVMGIYSRVAAERGVWKAPANEIVRACVGTTYDCTETEQDILNPIGVNVIRVIPGRGIRVMGARTQTSVEDGRHNVHKRRTLNFIEESVVDSIQWAVFEPLNEDLWDQLSLAISVFYNQLWRDGALVPRDDKSRAYFVKIDEENNTQADMDANRLNIESGVNIVGMAEFIIFSVGLWDGGRLLEELAA